MQADLVSQGQALVDSMAGVPGALAEALEDHISGTLALSIAHLGQPACGPVILVRPSLGPAKVPGQKCQFTANWLLAVYWDIDCGLECAHLAVYTLMSGCGVPGSLMTHLSTHANLAPLRAIGVGLQRFDAPRGFQLAKYATAGEPNTYWAQLPITLTFSC